MNNKNTTTEMNPENWHKGYIHAGAALHRIIEAQGEMAAFLPGNAHLVREIAYYCPPHLERLTFAILLALHLTEGKSLDEVAEEMDRILAFRQGTIGSAAATLEAHGMDDWLTLEECVERLQSITTLAPAERDALISQAQEAERHKNYTEASYLMEFIAATQGKDVLALPEHTALVLKMVRNAPPAMAAEFDAILLPPVTHVDAQGKPVFSLEQVAKQLGTTVQELEEQLQERPELREHLHSGPAFPLH
ncbi:hypothetical protein N5F13_14935 [Comamonas thiooxydans]|uniref:hypothetical protein n=1 Tax=Comamonas thiooxydans TaxID=363952 RepID=UPI0024483056|nr:hypothetical protein [Comamonas thiooxydans]MDH1475802.1 hypothetical protein [Comamonas thiooxydans]